jgi:hypothetical protein
MASSSDLLVCSCDRCGRPCQVAPDRNPDARLLRKSAVPKGLCVDCATTEWLLNTYPCNLLLDQSGPDVLRHGAIQEQFAAIMISGNADARPDEINWERVIANWDLPVKQVKKNPLNPYRPTHPKRAPRTSYPERKPDPLPGVSTITSFEQLNQFEPGLGDKLRETLRSTFSRPSEPKPAPDAGKGPLPGQGMLPGFEED